jgi:UDP-2-acetamido-3-amino-2,3-dideoxy-glucuronate N-acetyltransferase
MKPIISEITINLLNSKMKIHPTSDVQTTKIGSDTVIWQYTVVLQEASIGNNCNINAHCFIENDVIIGNNVTLKCGVYVWDGIRIEDDVFVGPSVTFINDKNPRSKIYPEKKIGAYIEKGVSLGANSTILGGIRIGRYALIGAGSVVTKDVPNNTLWIGNPARHSGYVCNCGHKLDKSLHCNYCNSDYELINNKIVLK